MCICGAAEAVVTASLSKTCGDALSGPAGHNRRAARGASNLSPRPRVTRERRDLVLPFQDDFLLFPRLQLLPAR